MAYYMFKIFFSFFSSLFCLYFKLLQGYMKPIRAKINIHKVKGELYQPTAVCWNVKKKQGNTAIAMMDNYSQIGFF